MFQSLENHIAYDIGKRSIAPLRVPGDLQQATKALFTANRVGILTGFYVLRAGTGETDGPPGAIALARGLAKLGKYPVIFTDAPNLPLLRAGLDTVAPDIPLVEYPFENTDVFVTHQLDKGFDHLVAIERAGVARDGNYYSMRGESITAYTAPMDCLIITARSRGIRTTGIGDGGNEIGMGKRFGLVQAYIPHGETIASTTTTDFLITCGVSNWGAWALLAGLSVLSGESVMPEPHVEHDVLQALIRAGAVDGITGIPKMLIDGFPLAVHLQMLESIRHIMEINQ